MTTLNVMPDIVIFPAVDHHHSLTSAKLYCLASEAETVNNLPIVVTEESTPQTRDRKSSDRWCLYINPQMDKFSKP